MLGTCPPVGTPDAESPVALEPTAEKHLASPRATLCVVSPSQTGGRAVWPGEACRDRAAAGPWLSFRAHCGAQVATGVQSRVTPELSG